MKKTFLLENMVTDMVILAEKSPMTEQLRALVEDLDFKLACMGGSHLGLRMSLIHASQEPWADVMYQSLYLKEDADPADRIVLQEPASADPMVGVVVLKAARLRGCSGFVYCGEPEVLETFNKKLPEYEKRGVDLSEAEFLECLVEAAEQDGLKIIFHRTI